MKNLALLAVVAAILSGCCSSQPQPPPCSCPRPCPSLINRPNGTCPCKSSSCTCAPSHIPQVNTYTKTRNEILDGFLAQWVSVLKFDCTKSNDGYEKVEVSLKNVTGSPIRVAYKFDWFNAQGEHVEDMYHTTFEKHTLRPGDGANLKSIAPSRSCVDFKLRIKYVQ